MQARTDMHKREMIHIRKATLADVEGICRVCAAGWRDTYAELLSPATIDNTIAEFYNPTRICSEVLQPDGWNGWWIAADRGVVVGAGGGGLIEANVSELFVLYVEPARRRMGIGTLLLDATTDELKQQGAREQWVSVEKGNGKGLPFYFARGFVIRGERPAYGDASTEPRNVLRLWRAL